VSWKSFPSLALSGWRNSQRKSGCCSGLLRLNFGLMHRSQISSTGDWHFLIPTESFIELLADPYAG
jgi:hypothetical protein